MFKLDLISPSFKGNAANKIGEALFNDVGFMLGYTMDAATCGTVNG